MKIIDKLNRVLKNLFNDNNIIRTQDTLVFTTKEIINQGAPILLVTHDEDDGSWQFLSGQDISEKDAMIVGLIEILNHDASLKSVLNLPMGYFATRGRISEEWIFQKICD